MPNDARSSHRLHRFHVREGSIRFSFYSGAIEFEAKEVKAGETVTVTGDWNWLDPNYSNDWSVTAWGNKGPVTIKHKLGLESDKMPVAPAKMKEEGDPRRW